MFFITELIEFDIDFGSHVLDFERVHTNPEIDAKTNIKSEENCFSEIGVVYGNHMIYLVGCVCARTLRTGTLAKNKQNHE